jgi:hypothetical protein
MAPEGVTRSNIEGAKRMAGYLWNILRTLQKVDRTRLDTIMAWLLMRSSCFG